MAVAEAFSGGISRNLAQRWQQQEEGPWDFLLIFLNDSPRGSTMFSELKDGATTKKERPIVTTMSTKPNEGQHG